MAYVALFVALGGTSYAALRLPANSVGSKQIRNNAVSSSKVHDRSLLAKDFKSGQLPRGATGPQGVPGTALGYLRLLPMNAGAARIDGAHSKNAGAAKLTIVSGTFCVSGLPFTPHSAIAHADQPGNGSVVIVAASVVDTGLCKTVEPGSQVEMTAFDSNSQAPVTPSSIVLWLE
ncbi:MAG: hypothetical protein QOK31_1427 [Solirubrobacteraceae bacterium]|nr:hypothetical protein [Solirubrobacteraceae bacterium]